MKEEKIYDINEALGSALFPERSNMRTYPVQHAFSMTPPRLDERLCSCEGISWSERDTIS